MNQILIGVCSFLCGILSGMGIGGGTLLLIFITSFLSYPQVSAQYINVLYFIPTALFASVINLKNKLVDVKIALLCCLFGGIFALLASFFATKVEPQSLRLYFNILLIFVGGYQLFKG